MIAKNSIKFSLKQHLRLIKHELKGLVKSYRKYLIIAIVLMQVILSKFQIDQFIDNAFEPTEKNILNFIFFPLINLFIVFSQIVCIFISGDSISKEFKSKTIMILASTPVSRLNIILSKFNSVLISIFSIEVIWFSILILICTILFGVFPPFLFISMLFIIIILSIFFGITFPLFISTFSKNVAISYAVPFLYIWFSNYLLFFFELDIILFIPNIGNVITYFQEWIIRGDVEMTVEVINSFIWLVSVPIILFILSLLHFIYSDIRV